MRLNLQIALLSIALLANLPTARGDAPVSYRNDIVPVLTKAGCNLGACHGAQTGKGRLTLSLRGEDPAGDHAKLIEKFLQPGDPAGSLMVRKATLEIPHEGGERFSKKSESYRLLARWISEGALLNLTNDPTILRLETDPSHKVLFAPVTNLHIQVTAHFSDGSKRDVNRWAIFEPSTLDVKVEKAGSVTSLRPGETTVTVRYLGKQSAVRLAFVPERPGFTWKDPPRHNFIDDALQEKWKVLRLLPSPLCDDSTFVRRAHLDLIGAIPKPEEARRFVADPTADKRTRLIANLLKRPEFADFWALKWSDLLRVEEIVLDRKGAEVFHTWIRESIAKNKPLDQFAQDLLTAMGSTYKVAPANYYRALRTPERRAEAVAQVFLGTRLACAKCHNHPFERWTMDDYYEFAAVFDGIDYDIKSNKRYDKNDKNNFIGEQIVKLTDKRKFKHPRSKEIPELRLLGQDDKLKVSPDRLKQLGEWLTSKEDPLFAKVQINRIWYHLMGRGLVDPVDDFRETNPAVNPPLLDALTRDLMEHGFDLRHAIRTICASRAYQLDSQPNEFNANDEINFARVIPRRLGAEQMLDSVYLALGSLPSFEGYKEPRRAISLPGIRPLYRTRKPTGGNKFLHLFGKPPRLTDSDTERMNETSLAQVFELTSGATVNGLLTKSDNSLTRLIKANKSSSSLVIDAYWNFLSREPTRLELEAALAHFKNSADRRHALEDLAWALLNAKEFVLRR